MENLHNIFLFAVWLKFLFVFLGYRILFMNATIQLTTFLPKKMEEPC